MAAGGFLFSDYPRPICKCVAGSSLRGSDVVDVGQGGSQDEGNHLQGAPMGGHARSVLLQGPRRGKINAVHLAKCTVA